MTPRPPGREEPVNASGQSPADLRDRIARRLDDAMLTSFAGLDVTCQDQVTVITGQFDQAALYGLLELIRSLRLDLLEARRIRGFPRRTPGWGPRLTAGG